jgi:hypothetical protein
MVAQHATCPHNAAALAACGVGTPLAALLSGAFEVVCGMRRGGAAAQGAEADLAALRVSSLAPY